MTSDQELWHRETARRKALWTLANILPGDLKALDTLDVFEDIEQRERLAPSTMEQPLSVEEAPTFRID